PAGEGKYRFQWTAPLLISPHDAHVLYTGANVLFKSTNEGQSWTAVSPDLTRHDPTTLGVSGGPITLDQTTAEYYATIFALAESPRVKGLIWTGSDDGLIHVTGCAGKNWTNVRPGRRLRARGAGRPGAARPLVRRHGARRVGVVRRRRPLGVAAPQLADRPGARPGDQGG